MVTCALRECVIPGSSPGAPTIKRAYVSVVEYLIRIEVTAVRFCLGPPRRGARVAERDGLENRCTRNGTVGSNPTLSAINIIFTTVTLCILFIRLD